MLELNSRTASTRFGSNSPRWNCMSKRLRFGIARKSPRSTEGPDRTVPEEAEAHCWL
jgi:hypothetical protein